MMIEEAALAQLARWENFYVIVGSSAGALTGLQFVVIALIAEVETASSMLEIRAFGTPTVVHFCSALLIAAVLSAPWPGLWSVGVALALMGFAGVIYVFTTIRHALRSSYDPDFADWMWFVVLPLLGYVTLAVSSILLPRFPSSSLFAIAGTSLLLVLIGIHNAWDSVTYITVVQRRRNKSERKQE